MQHLIESGTDIETLAKKKVDKERGLISMEDAAEEVIADSCEMMLENTQVPQMMAKENPGLFAQIREWLAEFAAKLRRAFEGVQARSAEAQAMMQYAESFSRCGTMHLPAPRRTCAITERTPPITKRREGRASAAYARSATQVCAMSRLTVKCSSETTQENGESS